MQDAVYVGMNLSQRDLREVAITSGLPPVEVCETALKISRKAWGVYVRGPGRAPLLGCKCRRPVALFGVAPTEVAGVGAAWFLATDAITDTDVGRMFHKQAALYLEEMAREFPTLVAVIPEESASAAMLPRLGFHAEHRLPEFGPKAAPCLVMVRRIAAATRASKPRVMKPATPNRRLEQARYRQRLLAPCNAVVAPGGVREERRGTPGRPFLCTVRVHQVFGMGLESFVVRIEGREHEEDPWRTLSETPAMTAPGSMYLSVPAEKMTPRYRFAHTIKGGGMVSYSVRLAEVAANV